MSDILVQEPPSVAGPSLREREGDKYGGSAEGIRQHYDLDTQFWRLVLGPTLTYSCALFTGPDDHLDAAQQRKIDWHLDASGARTAKSVLDVGCGWGSVLLRLSGMPNVERSVGITLSTTQAQYLQAQDMPRVEVRLENWAVHEPVAPYDSIISIGAFEHFAKPEETQEEKISVYADFFARCHRWLSPGGRLSLQTIAFGNMEREGASDFMNREIFPDSDLPFLQDVVAAVEGLFEITAFRNDRLHYARTYDRWAANLRQNREQAVSLVGEEAVSRYERYFKLTSMGFRMGKQHLLRFALRPIRQSWSLNGADYWGAQLA
ncbi:MAG: cyclopropane-fatty-acyl-phospholipid synthase family protein [Acidobacteriota bacterium]|nr:cyclopropane-fatty-acyl-phospholipid synthase family protein [Acidobacteriota bacterium]